ncbi:MAG TPA: hypothetical protein VEY51_17410 [Chondromyces sp.]|nr:hypothetical protein [Chondromyces sp.]
MKNKCSKCNSIMVEAKLDSFPFRIYKAGEKPNSNTMSNITPYICTSCGFIDFYATEPEKFN